MAQEKFELKHVVVPSKLVKQIMEYLKTRPLGEVQGMYMAMTSAVTGTIEYDVKKLEEYKES
jgi:hypothetical protein